MAIRIPVVNNDVSPGGAVKQILWTGLLNGDTGDWVRFAQFSGKTFQVYGAFGVGGSVTLQGSNDATAPVNAATLSSWQATALTLTAGGFATARDMPMWVRPIVTAGDGTTSVSVALAAHRQDMSNNA